MKYRRLVLFLFCVIMAVTLCGCNNSQELSKDHTEESKANNESIQLDIDVIKTETGDEAFSISLTDFIESFNSYYSKNNSEIFLKGLEEWQIYDAVVDVNNDIVTTCYAFSEDMDIRALPQLRIYADNTKSGIRQISMCYDIHSFSPETYERYEELCYYVMRTMMTGANDSEVETYTSKLLDALDESFTTDKTYQAERPEYTWGKVGAYPYYVVGETTELRLIPAEN